ncbi:putative membrane protein YgcG [Paenibacillus sp. W4I10]|uniref:hypothetical protein n=1 Tax=Paenibacillus sp. W4I10 TaxID=3042298 RepID=UPI002784AE09|nr:hypothetical protein [Paenibacillus sp. W4I10]MDQ0721885.1 putative membrane protein YgcG [Paenibacillus sp. W4I10]
MPIYYYLAAVILVVTAYLVRRKLKIFRPAAGRRRKQMKVTYRRKKAPLNLGLREEVSYQQTILQLEKSYNKHFANKLKIRIQQEYPHMKTLEYRWKLIELKRYFIMASLLKQVPMFSDEVDDLWHEMLMFTKSYADFCAEFMGSTVHHEPAITRRETPGARAWFDWVYCQIFEFTPYSAAIWGDFFAYPLSSDVQKLIAQGDQSELVNELFHARRMQEDPEAAQVITYLIDQIRRSATLSEEELSPASSGSSDVALVMASAMVYYSMHNEATYGLHMGRLEQEILPQEKAVSGSSSISGCTSGSSCYTDQCTDSGSSSGGSGSSSGSSSDSSCSSSSCSSCGGGGD